MDAQQYSLSWNHFHSNLSTGFQSLLREQDLVDVTLAVEGKYFKAHKMVLSICSPYFKELFHATPCKYPIVMLQDVQYRIMKSLLMFMYQGEVKVSQADLPAFMKLAESLKVKGLTEDDGREMETEKRLEVIPNQRKETSTNGLFPPEEQSSPRQHRHIRPKHPLKSITPPPSTSTSTQNVTPPKKPKLDSETALDSKLEAQTTLEKKSKETTMLSIRLEALQAHQQILAHQQQQKELQRQKKMLSKVQQITAAITASSSTPVATTQNQIDLMLLPVKEEPVELEDEAQDDMEHEHMVDMSSIVATSLGDGSEDMEGGQTETRDSATPGPVMVLRSRRGLPVAIHDGHIYTKHKVEPSRTLWLCVKQRNLQCGGCLTTDITEQHVLAFSGHNHRQLHDIIQRLQTAGGNTLGLGSGSSNCGSSSNSSPSHSHDRQDFPLEPTDLSLSSSTASAQSQSSHL